MQIRSVFQRLCHEIDVKLMVRTWKLVTVSVVFCARSSPNRITKLMNLWGNNLVIRGNNLVINACVGVLVNQIRFLLLYVFAQDQRQNKLIIYICGIPISSQTVHHLFRLRVFNGAEINLAKEITFPLHISKYVIEVLFVYSIKILFY